MNTFSIDKSSIRRTLCALLASICRKTLTVWSRSISWLNTISISKAEALLGVASLWKACSIVIDVPLVAAAFILSLV